MCFFVVVVTLAGWLALAVSGAHNASSAVFVLTKLHFLTSASLHCSELQGHARQG